MIIFEKEISDYYNQPLEDMYNDLRSIKKDKYLPGEKIIITAYKKTDKHIWKHFYDIIYAIDIPTFFVHLLSNDNNVKLYAEQFCNDIVNFEFKNNITNFEKNKNFCVNPFLGIELRVDGKITPCCDIKNETGVDIDWPNIKDTTLEQAFHSEPFTKLREDFKNNLYPSACDRCWRKESIGVTSKRQKNNYEFLEETLTTNQFSKPKVKIVDLKVGIQCNLKCRICSHNFSSLWYSEDKKFSNVPDIKKLDYTLNQQKDFFVQELSDFDDISLVTFSGGEPFLDNKHLEFLKKLIDQGKDYVKIHYNTNGTIFSEKHLEVLDKFKNVSISVSIDNIQDRFEYERNGVQWSIVENNLKLFSKLNREKFRLDFHTVVSIFNISTLDKTLTYADNLNIKHELNLVKYPPYFDILNIPINKRNNLIQQLEDSKFIRVKEISNILKQDTYINLNTQFWNRVNEIDKRRNQNFTSTYPEMSEIMKLD